MEESTPLAKPIGIRGKETRSSGREYTFGKANTRRKIEGGPPLGVMDTHGEARGR